MNDLTQRDAAQNTTQNTLSQLHELLVSKSIDRVNDLLTEDASQSINH